MIFNQLFKNYLLVLVPFLALLSLINGRANAQNSIPIGISPMDQTPTDNSFYITPDFSSQNNPNNIPPLPSKTPATDTITIQGNTTPSRLPNINGSAVNSNQSLPSPPQVSEPYRAPITSANETNSSVNIGISPYDYTPTDNVSRVTPSNNANRIIDNNSNAITPVPTNQNPSTRANSNVQSSQNSESNQRRRTLREIMVFDTITPPPSSNSTVARMPNSDNSSSPVAPVAVNFSRFRVMVGATNSAQEERVKAIYPDAFRSTHGGNSVLQIGVFSSQQNAQKAAQPLRDAGLNPILIPIN